MRHPVQWVLSDCLYISCVIFLVSSIDELIIDSHWLGDMCVCVCKRVGHRATVLGVGLAAEYC